MGRSNKLTLYVDLMSQPCRAVLIFCRVNNIDAELVTINLARREQIKPEFKAINPLKRVPVINDSGFKLAESGGCWQLVTAIHDGDDGLVFVSNSQESCYHGVFGEYTTRNSRPLVRGHTNFLVLIHTDDLNNHSYPNDAQRRAKIDSVLDWHHSNLRRGSSTLIFHRVLAPVMGVEADPRAAVEGENILKQSLKIIETVFLQEGYPFLAGGKQLCIADLSLVCELKQLEMLEKSEMMALLSPYKRITAWISAVETATNPHFSEVHQLLYKAARRAQEQRAANSSTQNSGADKIADHKAVSKL